jgi:hypothetical protein
MQKLPAPKVQTGEVDPRRLPAPEMAEHYKITSDLRSICN